MTVASFSRADDGDLQLAFTGLLAHPLVAPWTFPDLFTLVIRYEHRLTQWCERLCYRLIRIDQCFRLRRVPLGGEVAVPRGTPPARRTLVLALLAAAILEDERQDSLTLQEISDAVRRFAAVNDFRAYDPQQQRHRRELVEAVRFLAAQGVLEQRTQRSDLVETWERAGDGIGAGYVVHRDALVLLADTRDAELALGLGDEPGSTADTRGPRLLRRLVETQALELGALTDDEAAYLVSQRGRLIDQAEQMTGGVVEVRQDAWILVLPSDQGLDPELLVAFPEATAADWVALALLDAAGRAVAPGGEAGSRSAVPGGEAGSRSAVPGGDAGSQSAASDGDAGCRYVPSATVDALATTLHAEQGSRLTVVLRESPKAVREAAEQRLRAAGLLTVATDGGWTLLPAAGRYRDATLEVAKPEAVRTVEPASLFEEMP